MKDANPTLAFQPGPYHPIHFYWKTYFDIGYYICIIPYRFQWDDDKQEWITRRSYFQLVFHICFMFLADLSVLGTEISQVRPSINNPMFYVDFIFSAAMSLYYLPLLYVLWTKQKEFVAIFNFKPTLSPDELSLIRAEIRVRDKHGFEFFGAISSGGGCLYHSSADKAESQPRNLHNLQLIWSRLKRVSADPSFIPKCVVFLLLFQPTLTGLRVLERHKWNINTFMIAYANQSQFMFFLDKPPAPNSVYAWLAFIFSLYSRLTLNFVDMLCIVTTLYFWRLVNEFSKKYGEGTKLTVHQVMIHHKILKDTMTHVNEAICLLTFVFSIMTIPFFCEMFTSFFNLFETVTRIHWGIYSFYYFVTLRLASSGARKMENLYNWFFLGNHFVKCSQIEIDVYLNEMRRDDIAMKAGFVAIRDGLLRSILGLILTYSFVLMQFEQQQKLMAQNRSQYAPSVREVD